MSLKRVPQTDPSVLERVRMKEEVGFHAPLEPDPENVLAYLRLYLAEREKWDERPEVGVLRSSFTDHVTGYPLAIPDASWDTYNDPTVLLKTLVRVLWKEQRADHALLRKVDPSMLVDMVGVYFRHEGWSPPEGSEKNAAELARNTRGKFRFKDMDGAYEVRCAVAVTVSGLRYRVSHNRSSEERFLSEVFNPLAPYDGRATVIAGDLPSLLQELTYGLVKTLRPAYANTPYMGQEDEK